MKHTNSTKKAVTNFYTKLQEEFDKHDHTQALGGGAIGGSQHNSNIITSNFD